MSAFVGFDAQSNSAVLTTLAENRMGMLRLLKVSVYHVFVTVINASVTSFMDLLYNRYTTTLCGGFCELHVAWEELTLSHFILRP